jgi:drug/metabolite transporter (DMT)-like permease
MKNSNRPSILKPAMTYGVIIALVMIILAVLTWIMGQESAKWIQWISWIAYFGALYYCLKNWRDQHNGGYLHYKQAFGAGVLFMFFASIIYAFYNVIYLTWIDPESVDRMIDLAEETYYKQGLSDDQVEMAMSWFSKMKSPGMQFFSVIFGTTLIGVIISLIVSFFIKKEGDPYQQAMSEIENTKEE